MIIIEMMTIRRVLLIGELLFLLLFIAELACGLDGVYEECTLPESWHGRWYTPVGDDDTMAENRSGGLVRTSSNWIESDNHFLSKGQCVEHRENTYFFYDKSNSCYRCMFIIQKHFNIIQYKETHCDRYINNFDDLCTFLTPYLPLITIIREESVEEECPLRQSYQLENRKKSVDKIFSPLLFSKDQYKKCLIEANVEVTRCSSMHELRLNFQDCVEYAAKASSIKKIAPMIFRPKEKVGSKRAKRSRQDSHSSSIVESLKSGRNEVRPLSRISGIIVTCLASWKENGWVFLVAKRVDKPVKPGLSCMFYRYSGKSGHDEDGFYEIKNDKFMEFNVISNEFCQDFDALSNNYNSFTLEKVSDQIEASESCEFTSILSLDSWKSSDGSRSLMRSNPNEIHIRTNNSTDELKLTCIQMLASNNLDEHETNRAVYKSRIEYFFLVDNILECSTQLKCFSIEFKSRYVVHIKYGDIDHETKKCINQNDLILDDLFYLDSDSSGLACPFSETVYKRAQSVERVEIANNTICVEEENFKSGCDASSREFGTFKTIKCGEGNRTSSITKSVQMSSFDTLTCLAQWKWSTHGHSVVLSRSKNSTNLGCSIWHGKDNVTKSVSLNVPLSVCLNKRPKQKDYKALKQSHIQYEHIGNCTLLNNAGAKYSNHLIYLTLVILTLVSR